MKQLSWKKLILVQVIAALIIAAGAGIAVLHGYGPLQVMIIAWLIIGFFAILSTEINFK